MGICVQSTRKIDGFPGNFGYTEKKGASMSKAVVSGPGRKRSQPEERHWEESLPADEKIPDGRNVDGR